MARLDQAIYSRLQAVTGVTDLVSTRCYPLVLPQNPTYPAVRYQQIDGFGNSAMGSDTGVVEATVQIDSYATTYTDARALAEAVRAALLRFRGTVASVEILDIFRASGPNDIYEENVKIRRVQYDFNVWHRE